MNFEDWIKQAENQFSEKLFPEALKTLKNHF